MTLCPRCGGEIEAGKSCCADPARGAAAPRPEQRLVIKKDFSLNFKLDFVTLARLAAILIAMLASAWLYFFAKV